MSRFATVLTRVDVCGARVGRAGRAISLLVVVFAFALLLAFLERVDLHPVIICTRSIGRIRSKVSGRVIQLHQSCSKCGTVGVCTQMQTVHGENRCHIHHHCVLHCICQRSFRSASPFSDIQLPGSQSLIQNLQRGLTRVSQAS